MHSFHFFLVNTSLGWSACFVLRLTAKPSWGLLARCIFLPSFYTRPLAWLASRPGFFLQGAHSNTLDIFFRCILRRVWSVNLEGRRASAHSLSCKGPLYSWGVSLWLPCLSEKIGWGSEVVWGTWGLLPRNLVLRICPNFLGNLPLFSVLPHPFGGYWIVAFLWDHLGTMVPFW